MKTPHAVTTEVQQRYAAWEASAPLTFVVLSISAVATGFVRLPSAVFFVSQIAAGVAVFGCWRFARAQRQSFAAICACLSFSLVMVGLLNSFDLPLYFLMAQGFSILGATMAGLFWGGRYAKG